MNEINISTVIGNTIAVGSDAYGCFIEDAGYAVCRREGMKLPDGCKTMLDVNPANEKIGVRIAEEDGMAYGITDIMPDITGVEITDGICPVTTVYFSDGTFQRVKFKYGDCFSEDHGVSFCIAKKLCDIYAPGHGSSIYNKLVDRGLNVLKRQREEILKHEKDEAERKEIAARRREKNKKRKAKKAARDRENQIEIMAEAIRRAMNR